jgi:NAD(P)H-hydrate epimerase
MAPEAMIHPGPATEQGSLGLSALTQWSHDVSRFDAVLVGPGMTIHAETGRIVEWLLANCHVPLVIDADGLNVLAGKIDSMANRSCPLVITPHPGEMARLQACSAGDVQGDRMQSVRRAAAETRAVVVLKGAGTLVAEGDRPVQVNLTGNPGMAKGGMGDVLGGFLAGLLAQGQAPFDAARLAVHLHGRAGDHVAWRSSQAGMTAGDVIHELARVYREISLR